MRYDDDAGGLFWVTAGNGHRFDVPAGSLTARGYRRIFIGGRSHYAHRLVWLFVTGHLPAQFIDHIDGNPANNRISNLRECTLKENSQNMVVDSSRPFPAGVRLGKSYRACIRADGIRYELGSFPTPEAAHAAYLEAKLRLHPFQPVPRYHSEPSHD